jgi:hypothetical protein
VKTELTGTAITEIVLQGVAHGDKSKLIPRNLVFVEQPRFQAFGTGSDIRTAQLAAEE